MLALRRTRSARCATGYLALGAMPIRSGCRFSRVLPTPFASASFVVEERSCRAMRYYDPNPVCRSSCSMYLSQTYPANFSLRPLGNRRSSRACDAGHLRLFSANCAAIAADRAWTNRKDHGSFSRGGLRIVLTDCAGHFVSSARSPNLNETAKGSRPLQWTAHEANLQRHPRVRASRRITEPTLTDPSRPAAAPSTLRRA